MAATQIKNGFQGGTDDQMLVNPDGSINVNSSGGGGSSEVNIHDSAGNALTSVNGALNTNQQGFSALSPGFPTQVSVGTSSIQLFAVNPNRKYAHIVNNSSEQIFIQYSVMASINQGIRIPPRGFFTLESNNLWLGIINAIGVISNQLIDVLEGE